MITVGLLVRLEAKPGKEAEVESFLKSGLALVEDEPETTVWFAIRMVNRPSASLTHFQMTQDGKLISPAESRQL